MSTKKTFRILATLMFVVCIIFALSSCEALDNILVKKQCAHTMEETAAVAATCEQEGNIQYFTCSTCNKVYLDKDGNTETTLDKTVVAKTDHVSGGEWKIDSEATCDEAGSKHKECTVCGAVTSTDSIPAKGHTEVIDAAVEATCTEAGKTEGKHCSVCNEVLVDQVTVEALGHNADGSVAHVDATCTEAGVVGGTYCTVCNDGKAAAEAAIPAAGHNTLGTVAHVEATCTEAGVVGGTYCTVCNEGKAAAEAVIPAHGHDNAGSVAHVDATCTEAGVVGGTYCTVCNEGKAAAEAVIPALGHNYGEWIDEIPAYVGEEGTLGHYNCSACGKNFDADKNELDSLVIPAIIEGTTAEYPIFVMFNENGAATVTVPAGATYYFASFALTADAILTANGDEITFVPGERRMPGTFTITNDGAEAADYALVCAYKLGSMSNPEIIEDMNWYYGYANLAAGNSQGYFYTYVATATGTVTFYFGNNEGLEDYVLDIMITNLNSSVQKSLLADGVDNYGLEVTIDVEAGDELMIVVAAVQDAEGNRYPEVNDLCWVGNFAYPAGTEYNPIQPEWVWDDDYVNASITVTVPAGETLYFGGQSGMILTVNGVVTEMNEDGVFSITNNGAEAAEYALALATPVGAYNNPEIIEGAFEDTKSLAEGGSYYYLFKATEDTVLVFTITDGANITIDRLTYVDGEDWPISEQFILAEPETDDNWNYIGWIVADKLVIEVKAGQELKIQVNGLTDWNTYMDPAIDYTINVAYAEGTKQNPIMPEFAWNDEQTEASATVTVPAGATYYFATYYLNAETFITANGVELAFVAGSGRWVPSTFSITNDGEEDAEYALKIAYKVGTMSNPAEAVIGANTADIAAGSQPYFYTFVAPAKGTFTFEILGEAWFYVINDMTNYIYGDNQWSDSDPVVNVVTLELNEGDVLQIQVNTYDPADMWNAPAGTVSFNVAYHAHVMVDVEAKDATCTEAGYTAYKACECGLVEGKTVIDALGHEYEATVTPPSCTEAGYTTHECVRCDNSYTDSSVPATGHTWGAWNETVAPTEDAAGEARRDCDVCDAFETKVVPKLNHDCSRWPETTLDAVDPTCTTTGLTEGKACSDCGAILVEQQTIPALGHDLSDVEGKAATCTEAGYTAYKACSRCDHIEGKAVIEALGHDLVDVEGLDATCTEAGYTAYKDCSRCDYIEGKKVINALGHDLVDVEGLDATCTEAGYTAYKDCSRCNYIEGKEVINATGHNTLGVVEAKDATCTEDGVVGGIYCTACNEGKAAAEEAIPALGHNYGEWIDEIPAYVGEEGTLGHYTCSVCNKNFDADKNELDSLVIPAIIEGTTAEYPIFVMFDENGAATVTVPAGATYYFASIALTADAILTANGDEITFVPGARRMPGTFTITNDGAEDAEYALVCAYKIGSMSNPAVVVIGANTADIAANAQGYFYTFVAPAKGTFTFEILGEAWSYAINNFTTYVYGDTQWSDSDPVVNVVTLELNEGDELQIIVNTYDPASPFSTPAGTISFNVTFHAHELVDVEGLDATCLEAGYTAHKVCECGYVEGKEVINALGHDIIDVEALAKTCYKDGFVAHKACTGCDYTEGFEVVPACHEMYDVEAKAATCYTDGYNAHKACSDCYYTDGKIVAPAGHTGEWIADDKNEYETIICTVCGRKATREINNVIADVPFPGEDTNYRIDYTDALHAVSAADNGGKYLVFDFDVLLDKSAAEYATTEYLFSAKVYDGGINAGFSGNLCVQFQFVIKENVVSIAGDGVAVDSMPYDLPMGETYLSFRIVADLDDAKNEAGNFESYYYLYAKVTGSDEPMTLVRKYTKTSSYAGTISRYDNYKVVLSKVDTANTAPQCVLDFANASFIRTNDANYLYSNCDHEIEETITPATDCTTDGTVVRKCTVDGCGYTVTEAIPAVHTPGAAATCTTAQICTACQEVIAPALGHNFSEWIAYDANNEQRICDACGRMQKREITKVIEDVVFPPADGGKTTKIDFTDVIHSANADGGKYLVFDVDILLGKSTQSGTTENVVSLKINDGGGNNVAGFQINMKNNELVISGTAVNTLPVLKPMGETYITFRIVGVLASEKNASGNYVSTYYLYAKETGTEGPMTLVRTATKTSSYTGTVTRADNYNATLYAEPKAIIALDFNNASFIRTNDANYLYSDCDHVFGEWSVTDAVACTTDGVATRSCTVEGCGYTETEYIPAHNITTTPGQAPTCTEDGYTISMACADCDYAIAATTIAKLGHTMSDWTDINDGAKQKKTCANGCGYYELRDVRTNAPLTFDDGTVTNGDKITYSGSVTVAEDKTTAADAWNFAKLSVKDGALVMDRDIANWASGRSQYAYFGTTDGSTEGNIYTLDFDLYIDPASNATNNSSRVAAQLYFGGGSYSIGTYGAKVTRYGQQSKFTFGTTKTWISFRFVFTVTVDGAADVVVSVKNASGNYQVVETYTVTGSGIRVAGVTDIGFTTYAAAGSFTNYIDNISLVRHTSGYEAQ